MNILYLKLCGYRSPNKSHFFVNSYSVRALSVLSQRKRLSYTNFVQLNTTDTDKNLYAKKSGAVTGNEVMVYHLNNQNNKTTSVRSKILRKFLLLSTFKVRNT